MVLCVCAGAGLLLVWPLEVKLSAFGGGAVVVAGMFISVVAGLMRMCG